MVQRWVPSPTQTTHLLLSPLVSMALAAEGTPVLLLEVLLHLSTVEFHFIGELEMRPALATQD